MTSREEIQEAVEKQRRESTSGVYEISKGNLATLRELFDDYHEIFCPTEDTTFEEFCGFMMVAGSNFLQREFIKFALKQMIEGLGKK